MYTNENDIIIGGRSGLEVSKVIKKEKGDWIRKKESKKK